MKILSLWNGSAVISILFFIEVFDTLTPFRQRSPKKGKSKNVSIEYKNRHIAPYREKNHIPKYIEVLHQM